MSARLCVCVCKWGVHSFRRGVIRPSNLPLCIPALLSTTSNLLRLRWWTYPEVAPARVRQCNLLLEGNRTHWHGFSRLRSGVTPFHRQLSENNRAAVLIFTTLTECTLIHQWNGEWGWEGCNNRVRCSPVVRRRMRLGALRAPRLTRRSLPH